MSVRPSVRMEQRGSHWTDFHEIWWVFLGGDLSREREFNFSLKSGITYITWRPNLHLLYIAELFLQWEMLQIRYVEEIKTRVLCPIILVFLIVPFFEKMWKNTGLFEMIVGVLTTCHTQYTWYSSICIFLFNRTTLQVCYIPYRCSICAPSVILQTSTR